MHMQVYFRNIGNNTVYVNLFLETLPGTIYARIYLQKRSQGQCTGQRTFRNIAKTSVHPGAFLEMLARTMNVEVYFQKH